MYVDVVELAETEFNRDLVDASGQKDVGSVESSWTWNMLRWNRGLAFGDQETYRLRSREVGPVCSWRSSFVQLDCQMFEPYIHTLFLRFWLLS